MKRPSTEPRVWSHASLSAPSASGVGSVTLTDAEEEGVDADGLDAVEAADGLVHGLGPHARVDDELGDLSVFDVLAVGVVGAVGGDRPTDGGAAAEGRHQREADQGPPPAPEGPTGQKPGSRAPSPQ